MTEKHEARPTAQAMRAAVEFEFLYGQPPEDFDSGPARCDVSALRIDAATGLPALIEALCELLSAIRRGDDVHARKGSGPNGSGCKEVTSARAALDAEEGARCEDCGERIDEDFTARVKGIDPVDGGVAVITRDICEDCWKG